ncbi:hypothetical protein [Frigidibacter sp.]|uniref:hypothetical protein n=1 Tax=Frigidibacter sp. TaxID=2586418 RepID=UPI0027363869|nr:hypothetical protein [Frigidibacter sp.]MDP3341638.1 hypothetical protein [Frigidibacter sp.]
MPTSPPSLKVEPTGESAVYCDCCGNQSRTIWGFVHEGEGAIASYFLQWTVGAPLSTHPANFDLIYGAWGEGEGEGASKMDRYAVSMVYFEGDSGPAISVIDAADRPVAKSELVGTVLSRDCIIGTPLAQRVFAIFDAVLLQDERLGGH